MSEISLEQQVEEAKRVSAFLKDEAVQRVLSGLQRQYYEDFKQAGTAESIQLAHARARVIEDFATQLQVLVDNGRIATVKVERQEEAERIATARQQSRQRSGR